ncbi:MAG TPA: nitroreductase family protein [Lachnospiraceae bacterium]|nr:nitroreductase family protein [Lachnospiraceae bacterium]
MDFYEAVRKRRTIRDFENVELDPVILERIIGAGLMAPTNDHMRDWHYIVIDDKNVAMKLLDLVPKEFSDEDMDHLIID